MQVGIFYLHSLGLRLKWPNQRISYFLTRWSLLGPRVATVSLGKIQVIDLLMGMVPAAAAVNYIRPSILRGREEEERGWGRSLKRKSL